ncbi:hypothetical protein TWF106_001371 [Orbilia oligospora]|nr:hypothetical protein TWF106_001371 [Orbilia oligospora]KAF3207594.1 hypothetical protein TWF191_000983 [Orbilia oligospora]KAF3257089.1 hypothetical protein TWF192_001369 [Orbilia oligospora]
MPKELCEFSVLERSATIEVGVIFGSFPKEPSALKAWSIFVDNLWEPVGKRSVTLYSSTARGPLSKQESDFEEHEVTIDKIARPIATSTSLREELAAEGSYRVIALNRREYPMSERYDPGNLQRLLLTPPVYFHLAKWGRLGYFQQAIIVKLETNEKWSDKQFRIQKTDPKK